MNLTAFWKYLYCGIDSIYYSMWGRISLRTCGFDFQDGHWDFALTSGRTRPLGSTQPLLEKNTRRRGKGNRWVGLTSLSLSCAECLEILGASASWSPIQACTGIAFTFKVRIP
jgi:hypothetical protein